MSQEADWEAAQSAPPKTDVSDDASLDVSVATMLDAQDTESSAVSLMTGAGDNDTAGEIISATAAMASKPSARSSRTEESTEAAVELHQEADELSLS